MKTVVIGGAFLGLAFAAFVFSMRVFADHGVPPRSAADWLGEVAFVAVYAAPSVLALLALRDRYGALLSASVLSALLSWTAFSGVTLVLLVPAAAYAVAYVRVRAWDGASSPLWSLVAVAAGYAAFCALFARDDPYCWKYVVHADGTTTFATVSDQGAMSGQKLGRGASEAGGGCHDRVTPLESMASLSLAGLALVGGWIVAGRPRGASP